MGLKIGVLHVYFAVSRKFYIQIFPQTPRTVLSNRMSACIRFSFCVQKYIIYTCINICECICLFMYVWLCRKKTRQERLINISINTIAKLSDIEIQKTVPAMAGRHGGVYFSLFRYLGALKNILAWTFDLQVLCKTDC